MNIECPQVVGDGDLIFVLIMTAQEVASTPAIPFVLESVFDDERQMGLVVDIVDNLEVEDILILVVAGSRPDQILQFPPTLNVS